MPQINAVFVKICNKLNLSETLYQKLKEHYKAVSDYLNSCADFELKIYPQGSVAIQTTIKPILREEYDLDFVCEARKDPFKLFDWIKDTLKANGRYKNLIEEKKRCVRINYTGNFHLDILPACSDEKNVSATGILIPDKELKKLLSSDPKGYITWFQKKSGLQFTEDKEIEAFPQYSISRSDLQHIVQLIKRHRDIFFQNQKVDQSPPSIILTTLCGEYYENRGGILNSMIHITDTIISRKIKEIYNPVDSKELLTEKWEKDSELYNKFIDWITALNVDLKSLKEGKKLNEELLFSMFGNNIQSVIDEMKERDHIHKNRDKLSISSTGTLSVSNTNPVPHNTFFGQKEED